MRLTEGSGVPLSSCPLSIVPLSTQRRRTNHRFPFLNPGKLLERRRGPETSCLGGRSAPLDAPLFRLGGGGGVWRAEERLPPTIKAAALSVEPTGAPHCLSCVTALKGEHATHCGEPDCSGVIDRLPGVIPRYGAAETNAGRNTRNLLSRAGSRRRGESSSLPQAETGNTGGGM